MFIINFKIVSSYWCGTNNIYRIIIIRIYKTHSIIIIIVSIITIIIIVLFFL